MDDDAKDRIIKDMNVEKGLRDELNRLMKEYNNQNQATNNQVKAIRERVTSDERFKETKTTFQNRKYIKVDENNYKQVLDRGDVLINPKTDKVYIRDEKGRPREVVDEKAK